MSNLFTTVCQKVILVALNFKFLYLIGFVLFISACDSSKKVDSSDIDVLTQKIDLKDDLQKRNNDTKIEISKIEAQNKLEIAQVQAVNQIEIQKVKSETTKDIALADVKAKSEDTKVIIYISSVVGILLLVLIVLIYKNSKKNRDIKLKLHEAELKQQKDIAEREIEEKRLQMMVDLVTNDKLPKEMQEELVSLMGKKSNLIIDSKIS